MAWQLLIPIPGEYYNFQDTHMSISYGGINGITTGQYVGSNDDFRTNNEGTPLWGEDGFTFRDFLDIINPIQHIPIVSSIYRKYTGDEQSVGATLAGGGLFGGVFGLVASIADVMINQSTGKDSGEHFLALFESDNSQADSTQFADTSYGPPLPPEIAPPAVDEQIAMENLDDITQGNAEVIIEPPKAINLDDPKLNERQRELAVLMQQLPPALPETPVSDKELNKIRAANDAYRGAEYHDQAARTALNISM